MGSRAPDSGIPQIETSRTQKTVKTQAPPYDIVQRNEGRFAVRSGFNANSTINQLCDPISLSSIAYL